MAGAQLGTTFSLLTGDDWAILNTLNYATNLFTQEAQAWRLVLADSNNFDADPSDPATETSAAVKIEVAMQAAFTQLILQEVIQ